MKPAYSLPSFWKRMASNSKPKVVTFPLRKNELNIHMISPTMHKQLFRFDPHPVDKDKLKRSIEQLVINNLIREDDIYFESYNIPLPKLLGPTLEEHYHLLAYEFCAPYLALAFKLASTETIPIPKKFHCKPGWTRYHSDGKVEEVEYPSCNVMIFDVESSIPNNNVPVMATAMSDKYWYTWLSEHLFSDKSYNFIKNLPRETLWKDMIPFGPSKTQPRLLIGHNVSFDRSFVKEEYLPETNFMYFLDTMSLHIMTRGYAETQRMVLRTGEESDEVFEWEKGSVKKDWGKMGCFNSLAALSEFYLNRSLEKSAVKSFINDDIIDIFKNVDNLLLYCAKDVHTTHEIFKIIWKDYHILAPHPVTFSGMLMISKCYFPLTDNWKVYINKTQDAYLSYESDMDRIITKLAQKHVVEGLQGEAYLNDPWLKYLDWTISGVENSITSDSFDQKTTVSRKNKAMAKKILKEAQRVRDPDVLYGVTHDMNWFPDLPENKNQTERKELYSGYPKWFKDLVEHHFLEDFVGPRPADIYQGHRIIPTILKLSWNGYPLYYHEKHQWGYLLPKNELKNHLIDINGKPLTGDKKRVNYNVYRDPFQDYSNRNRLGFENSKVGESNVDLLSDQDLINERIFGIYPDSEYVECKSESDFIKSSYYSWLKQDSMVYDHVVPEFYFVPIPHPQGLNKKCGNPLGNDYWKHIEDGKLVPMTGSMGMRFIHLLQAMAFWKNNRDRVMNQNVVYFDKDEKPVEYKGTEIEIGALLPKVVPAGTVTRRAVEKTWLTAINPNLDIIGSEMKSAIEAPEGFCFVGADVDSQEMWIASLIADASTLGTHGSTPFSFMSIQGNKARGSDLHSITANAIGIDRDNAKILNYGRLYGAGMEFAKNMIHQYQPQLSEEEAVIKAAYLYNFTKGIKCVELSEEGTKLADRYSTNPGGLMYVLDFYALMKKAKVKQTDYNKYGIEYWQGGTESEIFNVLEQFTRSIVTITPVLNVAIPQTLTSFLVKEDFLTSRMNWVVQSSAVDFLHIFLVTCYWLFSILKVPARLLICIHDEIRFMVPDDKKYEAVLALHIANLFTRAAFSQRLGIHDLPQSCAFFSSVEIDKVLRKEPDQKCQTPSNPIAISTVVNGFKCILFLSQVKI